MYERKKLFFGSASEPNPIFENSKIRIINELRIFED